MAGTNNSWNNQIAGSYNQIILNAGTNGVAISTDASAATVNVATGGAVKTTTLGSVSSTSATTVQSGSGALNVTATGGALTINSGTGTLSISSDASATTVNIATGGAAKLATLGSTNGASSLALKYGTADFTLASATGTVMSALDTGEITYPLQPAFFATPSGIASDVTGDGTNYTIIFDVETFDQNSDYNTGTGTFTAPVTGRYSFSANVLYLQATGVSTTTIAFITSNRTIIIGNSGTSFVGNMPFGAALLTDMDAADTVTIQANVGGGTKTVDVYGNGATDARTNFSGYLAC